MINTKFKESLEETKKLAEEMLEEDNSSKESYITRGVLEATNMLLEYEQYKIPSSGVCTKVILLKRFPTDIELRDLSLPFVRSTGVYIPHTVVLLDMSPSLYKDFMYKKQVSINSIKKNNALPNHLLTDEFLSSLDLKTIKLITSEKAVVLTKSYISENFLFSQNSFEFIYE